MKLRLTRDEMTARWRSLRSSTTPPVEASVTRLDDVEIDTRIEAEIDAWYDALLLKADPRLLAPRDLSALDVLETPGGVSFVELPEGTVRVLSVIASDWERHATIITDPRHPDVLRQRGKLTASCDCDPVAFLSGRHLYLYPFSGGNTLTSLQAVVKEDGIYELDSTALSIMSSEYGNDFSF